MSRSPFAALVPPLLLVLAACSATTNAYDAMTGHKTFEPVSQEELFAEITAFVNNFTNLVDNAAASVEELSPDLETRKRMLQWRIRTVQEMQSLLGETDARRAMTDLWIFLLQAEAFLDTPTATQEYGGAVETVKTLNKQLLDQVRKIAGTVIAPADMPAAEKQLADYVADNPLESVTGRSPIGESLRTSGSSSTVESIVRLPLAPFKVFDGVHEGAAAIRDFALIGNRFATIVQGMPQQLSWQTELVLLQLQNAPAVSETLASLERASQAAESISRTASTLPADLEKMLTSTQATVTDMDTTAKSLTAALEQASKTSEVIDRVFIASDPDAPPSDPPARPFDITEYTDTADGVSQMAIELRKTVESVDTLLADLDQRTAAIDELTVATVDHVKWSAIQVVGAILAAALVYRLLARFVGGPSRS